MTFEEKMAKLPKMVYCDDCIFEKHCNVKSDVTIACDAGIEID
jgi:hypothetical protein